MSHPKARLTFHGRLLLVQRVLEQLFAKDTGKIAVIYDEATS